MTESYPNSKEFLELARFHMRAWLEAEHGAVSIDSKSVVLPPAMARAGNNFYPGVAGIAQERFRHCFSKPSFGRSTRAGDALCSAHAPFNLFGPLRDHMGEAGSASAVFSRITGIKLHRVESIDFEEPRRRRDNPLNDNTAFDVFVAASGESGPVHIGIEVKFTEGPYSWGKTEREHMILPNGKYITRTRDSALLISSSIARLANPHLKQMWRNLLLGEALAQRGGHALQFRYVHLYPKGNKYQTAVTNEFAASLNQTGLQVFRPVLYEEYFDILDDLLEESEWRHYLRRRYLVAAV